MSDPFVPRRVSVHVSGRAKRFLAAGELRIFDRDVRGVRRAEAGRAGDLAIVYGPNDKPLALGLYDPESPVRVRVFAGAFGQRVDAAWIQQRVRTAVERRFRYFKDAETDGYRVLHGPGDGLPGLVVDRYAHTLVLKVYTSSWFPWLDAITEALSSYEVFRVGVLRISRTLHPRHRPHVVKNGWEMLWGSRDDLADTFRENGLRFDVDPLRGQKTGFFLDQRDNRREVEALASGRRVLNVFCYTGGFSLYAARGGATQVVSMDASQPAIDALARNVALNRQQWQDAVPVFEHRCEDAFSGMEALRRDGKRFGLVVIDPPSFAHKARDIHAAMGAYRRLARLGAALVQPEGHLVFASCSSRIGPQQLADALCDGVRAVGRTVRIEGVTGHPFDHPIATPSQQYLKCLFARVADA